MKGGTQDVGKPAERAVLVGIAYASRRDAEPGIGAEESLRELERLAITAGVVPVGTVTQTLRHITPATYIGAGKVLELKEAVTASGAAVVLIDENLSPVQQRNLTERLNVKVLDRSQLILDIRGTRPQPRRRVASRAGAARVHAAAPDARLTHLSRLGGGATRGTRRDPARGRPPASASASCLKRGLVDLRFRCTGKNGRRFPTSRTRSSATPTPARRR
jgi:GTP-binding protein HflX